jgi:dipeptidyl aminopeptidase/acylaminoacyl peptidase
MANIIVREEIKLTDSHIRLVGSGWGKEIIQNSIVERITYLSDGLKVKGYLAYPRKIKKEGKIPLVIWNRGGYGQFGAIDSFTARGMFGQIAGWGYAVLASQYRGNAGGEGKEEMGGQEVNDILNLFPVAEELQFIDTSIAGVEGWSRGGMMTFLLLKKKYDFKCALLIGAISDFKAIAESGENPERNYQEILGIKDIDNKLMQRSAVYFTDKLPDIPYLLIHGGADDTVPVKQTIELAKKFSEEKKKFRLVIFEQGDHYLKNHRKEVDILRKIWFDRYLKGEEN